MIAALTIGLFAAAAWFREDRLRMEREREMKWASMEIHHRWQRLYSDKKYLSDEFQYKTALIKIALQKGQINEETAKAGLVLLEQEYHQARLALQAQFDALVEMKP